MKNFIANFILVLSVITTSFASLSSDVRSSGIQQRFGPKLSAGISRSATVLGSRDSQPTYSKTGFVLAAQSMQSDCSSAAVATSGTAVNQCAWAGDSYYKYQLVQDNCDGGVKQFFSDENCVNYTGSSPLDTVFTDLNCTENTNTAVYVNGNSVPLYNYLLCTTNPLPVVTVDSAASMAYAEGHLCDESKETAYFSYNCDLCFTSAAYKYSYSYDCSVPGYVVSNGYIGEHCVTPASSQKFDDVCTGDYDVNSLETRNFVQTAATV